MGGNCKRRRKVSSKVVCRASPIPPYPPSNRKRVEVVKKE